MESEKEKLREELLRELQWVQYRQKMLDIIEKKLLEMRSIAEKVKEGNFTENESKTLTARINNLATQVRALDSESKRIKDVKILK